MIFWRVSFCIRFMTFRLRLKTENSRNSVSETLEFQTFPGEMPRTPPEVSQSLSTLPLPKEKWHHYNDDVLPVNLLIRIKDYFPQVIYIKTHHITLTWEQLFHSCSSFSFLFSFRIFIPCCYNFLPIGNFRLHWSKIFLHIHQTENSAIKQYQYVSQSKQF